jgi:hypothetical protein
MCLPQSPGVSHIHKALARGVEALARGVEALARGVDKFFKTLAKLASRTALSLTKTENN